MTAIFDMDGTLIDNSKFHVIAWEEFLNRHDLSGAEKIWDFFGKTNEQLMKYFFQRELSKDEITAFATEKEQIYREIYEPEIKPMEGLMKLLEDLKDENIKTGLATSAPNENVQFVLKHIHASKYFDAIVDDTQISNGKPDPEIFLTCAARLGSPNNQCIVFEDAVHGITAARRAHMKVVAIDTTHRSVNLGEADLVISDFTEVTTEKLRLLLKN